MKVAVHLAAWNGSKYIPSLFASLKDQTFSEWELFVLDNGSEDDTLEQIRMHTIDFPVPVHIIESKVNTGFAGGHNILCKKNKDTAQYVLLLNQDMHLQSDCMRNLVEYMDAHDSVAALSPRLMKWDFARDEFTDTIDSLGLKVFRNRRVIEQYTGKKWSDIADFFDTSDLDVFGVSGALPLYRVSALSHISFEDGTFFDESYHAYKEDVDVAYRLHSAGYDARVLLTSVAHHDRSGAGPDDLADSSAAKNKRTQSSWVKYHSYKNHLMTLYKNEYWQNTLLDLPFILWYELKKFIWLSFCERQVLSGILEIVSEFSALRHKRVQVCKKRKVSWKAFRSFV